MSRSARLRSKLDADMAGPDVKRRRLANNGLVGNGTTSRIGSGPRTRGMADTNEVVLPNVSVPNGPLEKFSSNSNGQERQTAKKTTETLCRADGDHETSSGRSSKSSSESSDSSDSEDSSDIDDLSECERKRDVMQEDLTDMEKNFGYLKEFLYKERYFHAEATLAGIRAGTAKEYLNPLENLQKNMTTRIKYAQNLRDFQLQSLQHKIDGETLAARQHYESERSLLIGDIRSSLQERIHRLEEDRNNDFTSELWLETVLKRKNKKSGDLFGDKKKKPITVSGPFIVYMLNDVDIVEDWTVMKKAATAPKRKFMPDSLLVI